ncbi:piezo-type mechanosensitive ion channel component 2-like protein [Labeo rohita]|uniref:Piezo-type mechanosensitive ion channel component 2-like protein n=1 Tax=Labeo rohita TaxID=84645 RepID=A0A498LN81_LABRO|nr:piezo-type mechanosensitive ion channel component 2-like protein [Labeo rohita]
MDCDCMLCLQAISLRYNGLSVVYLLFLLSVPLFPSPNLDTMKGKTGRFLLAVCSTGVTFLALQCGMQITFTYIPKDVTGPWDNIFFNFGIVRFSDVDTLNIIRLLMPDFAVFLSTLFILHWCKAKKPHHSENCRDLYNSEGSDGEISDSECEGESTTSSFGSSVKSHTSPLSSPDVLQKLIIFLTSLRLLMSSVMNTAGKVLVTVLLCLAGITFPSLTSALYFMVFLGLVWCWVLDYTISLLHFSSLCVMMTIFSGGHILILYLYQLPLFQQLIPPQDGFTSNLNIYYAQENVESFAEASDILSNFSKSHHFSPERKEALMLVWKRTWQDHEGSGLNSLIVEDDYPNCFAFSPYTQNVSYCTSKSTEYTVKKESCGGGNGILNDADSLSSTDASGPSALNQLGQVIMKQSYLIALIITMVHYEVWRSILKHFWAVVVGYSMLVLILIYVYQFKSVCNLFQQILGIPEERLRDIGLEQFDTIELFARILLPAFFLLACILQLHYFNCDFLSLTDLQTVVPRNKIDRMKKNTEKLKKWLKERQIHGKSSDQISSSSLDEHHEIELEDDVKQWLVVMDRVHELTLQAVLWLWRGQELCWRILELHSFKLVSTAIIWVCVQEVSLMNLLFLVLWTYALPYLRLRPLAFNVSSVWACVMVVCKMMYQLKIIKPSEYSSNCTAVCFVVAVNVIGQRMDVCALLHSFALMAVLSRRRRKAIGEVWPKYCCFIASFMVLQYLLCIGLPPALCIDDCLLLLVASLQWQVFEDENQACVRLLAGENVEISRNLDPQTLNQYTPVNNFLHCRSYLDMVKLFVFSYFFWLVLCLIFITGTTRINIFCLGYLVACFYFMLFGGTLLLQPVQYVLRLWDCLIAYTCVVISLKNMLSLGSCVYLEGLQKHGCWLIQAFSMFCTINGYNLPKPDNQCELPEGEAGIVWDAICFTVLLAQRRVFLSYYFLYVVSDLQTSKVLASSPNV